ncbi:hypothetical protein OS493_032186 [Desmophyllum pertusum]|uniref:Uncharacterized protein n=1 Tax=Desmophyllum pertusum TaxID=174260 RepID=A0A9W9ZXI2_9CNID|nr:hypothetical protein OS493_032186 [Desmophyllum pertusum]
MPKNKLCCGFLERVEFLYTAMRYRRDTETFTNKDPRGVMRWVLSSMEVGRHGVPGRLVVKSVEPVSKNAAEAVQHPCLETVVDLALEHPGKIERATLTTVQCTVVGRVGVDGRLAVNPAELVLKNVLEAAPIHRHVMAGKPAQEQRGKNKRATSNHALTV